MSKTHSYNLEMEWTGNKGTGTSAYRAYSRDHIVRIKNKKDIHSSSDPAFMGDATKHNPEELLLASLSTCHMLWYLHLCADAGIVVTAYLDAASGIMEETQGGGGRFTSVTLRPSVTLVDSTMIAKANELHHVANQKCFIANSVNFPVKHMPVFKTVNG